MIRVDAIQDATARHFGMATYRMLSRDRHRQIAMARQMAMYLARRLTYMSLPEIGRSFGGYDHTTVLWSVRKVESLYEKEPKVRDDIEAIWAQLAVSK